MKLRIALDPFRLAPCRHAFTRMVDKPFSITEWSFSGPSMFCGVGGPHGARMLYEVVRRDFSDGQS